MSYAGEEQKTLRDYAKRLRELSSEMDGFDFHSTIISSIGLEAAKAFDALALQGDIMKSMLETHAKFGNIVDQFSVNVQDLKNLIEDEMEQLEEIKRFKGSGTMNFEHPDDLYRQEKTAGRIGFYSRDEKYGWLSNFHRITLISGGKEYPTLEHLYQSQKAIDSDFQEWIRLAPNPYAAMKAGRSLRAGKPGELKLNWEDLKLSYMLVDLRLKFKDPELGEKLLATGDAYLYEDSPEDRFWGLVNGEGENHLGRLLMKVREELRR